MTGSRCDFEDAETAAARSRLIGEILEMAPNAGDAVLARFGESALALYRDHLLATAGPRGANARWTRPGDTPAILAYEPEA